MDTNNADLADPSGQQLFTCLSCSIAFLSADDQRTHYRSDHHRYNMKRRVAGLPPVTVEVFTQKVLERQSQTAVTVSPKGSTCEVCGKTYTTENAYRSHLNSKKHKDNELKPKKAPQPTETSPTEQPPPVRPLPDPQPPASQPEIITAPPNAAAASLTVDADAAEDDINKTIDEKIAAARARISPSQCLFCPESSSSIDENIAHMSLGHSFFVPDTEYLTDLSGLLTYLGEKIAIGNVCIYCGGTGREFRTLDAARKHMLDKGHCKLAYDTEEERLEVSDFYDFRSSYPDVDQQKKKRSKKPKVALQEVPEEGEWEDVNEDNLEADEIVDESATDEDSADGDDDSLELDDENRITFGDTPFQLVLPSGTRIGHRTNLRHYSGGSHLVLRRATSEDPDPAAATVRRLLSDKKSALVSRKGNFGAYGGGLDVIKARNAGEAREAGKHVRQYRDQNRREQFKTSVGFRHNHQKHYRDPLLQ